MHYVTLEEGKEGGKERKIEGGKEEGRERRIEEGSREGREEFVSEETLKLNYYFLHKRKT